MTGHDPGRASTLFTEAGGIALTIPDPSERGRALVLLAEVLQDHAPEDAAACLRDAEAAADTAPDVGMREILLHRVAEVTAWQDAADAERIVRDLPTASPWYAVEVLTAAAVAFPPGDAERSRLAAEMRGIALALKGASQATARTRIASVVAGTDPAAANGLLDRAEAALRSGPPGAGSGLMFLAETVADGEPDRAQALLREAESHILASDDTGVGRDLHLPRLASLMARYAPAEAERIARTLDPADWPGALLIAAKAIATRDLAEVSRIIGDLDDPLLRCDVYLTIAESFLGK
ncbi:hypothetical protein [Spirillospora sp. CA-128828]|uniref:hypothetical protein n=1 Tax=Spirillospora sp. CA-128828 TaxID=3240033 RepID=UPI003D8FD99F